MRIVHVLDDLSPANTGITTAVLELARAGLAAGCAVEVVSVGPTADWGGAGLAPHSAGIHGVGPFATWRYAPRFAQILNQAAGTGAIVHLHGLWMYPQWCAAHLALRNRWPLIVSVHNMLGGWLWRRGQMRRIKKMLYFNSFLKPLFSKAFAIQALSDEERGRIAQFFDDSQIVTIPNALNLHAVDKEIAEAKLAVPPERYALFIGRIHPQKGLEVLIEAAAKVAGLRVIIAGPTANAAYEETLREQCGRLGLSERVAFVGPVHGARKWKLLSEAWVFCSPTHTEGMSMAALEAMAAGVPVVTTHGSGLTEMDGAGSYLVGVDATEVAAVLGETLRWTPEERVKRGALARARVEQKFSWPTVWPQYEALYRSAASKLQ